MGLTRLTLALMLAATPLHAQQPPPRPFANPAIDIISASYGLRRTNVTCNVLQSVRERCQGRLRCMVTAADTLCKVGQKPPDALFATLVIGYRCMANETAQHRAQADRPLQASLSCAGLLRH